MVAETATLAVAVLCFRDGRGVSADPRIAMLEERVAALEAELATFRELASRLAGLLKKASEPAQQKRGN